MRWRGGGVQRWMVVTPEVPTPKSHQLTLEIFDEVKPPTPPVLGTPTVMRSFSRFIFSSSSTASNIRPFARMNAET